MAATKERLSVASPYEQTFKTRHRRVGRPADAEPLFVAPDVDPLIALIAKRRAYAVVHEEQRARMAEVFDRELAVLRRRGIEQVAADAGVKLADADADEKVGV
ncbi:hypothetical protein SEA_TINYMINY_1 [Microbacterium phage TinyMiny]|nr:hypothetical protein SEA_TINYMINY_1 [Microbacterium phage TinyMiny]UVF61330.1 hypothetical protein SEA_SPARCETUS_1 [Microbacterium phage Sparcetus]